MKHQIVLTAMLLLLAIAALLFWPVPAAVLPQKAGLSSSSRTYAAWLQSHLASAPADQDWRQ